MGDVVEVQHEVHQRHVRQIGQRMTADGLQIGSPHPEVTSVGGNFGNNAQAMPSRVAVHVIFPEADTVPGVAAVAGCE